jgi:cytochrome c oxidase subunit 1
VAELSGAQETRLSRIAAWLYGLGGAGFLLMFFFSGANSVPRRFAVHLPEWQGFAQVAVVFVVILALALAWVTIEVFRSVKPAWQRAQ